MRPKCWLENTVLTRKPSEKKNRNDRYEVGKYITDTGHRADPYFTGRFELMRSRITGRGWIWTHGRFKGYHTRTPLWIGYADEFLELP